MKDIDRLSRYLHIRRYKDYPHICGLTDHPYKIIYPWILSEAAKCVSVIRTDTWITDTRIQTLGQG